MIKKALLFAKNTAFSAIGFMIIATSFANFLNYVFNVVVARLLGPDRYGEFAALIAILMIMTVPANSLQALITKYISELLVSKDMEGIRDLIIKFFQICVGAAFITMVFFLAFRGVLADYLHIDSDIPVIVCGFTVAVAFFTPVFAGVLQGFQRFVWLGVFFMAYALARILFGWVFIVMGGGVAGAIGGGAVAVLIFACLSYLVARDAFRTKSTKVAFRMKGILRSYLPIIVSMVLFYAMVSFDQVIVKRKFSATLAGEYACASFMGKIILYFPSAVAIVLYPKFVEYFASRNRGKVKELLLKGSLITLAAGIALSLIFIAFPRKTISILYGSDYLGASSILWIFCIAMSCYALVNLFIYFFLAINRIGFVLRILILAFIFETIAMYVLASTPFQVAAIHIAINVILVVAGLLSIRNYASLGD